MNIPLTGNSHERIGIPPEKLDLFHTNMSALSMHVLLWPPWKQQIARGDKLSVIQSLTIIAALTTHTPRPYTSPINIPFSDDLSSLRGYVIKRGYSDGSRHVYFHPEKAMRIVNKDPTPKIIPGCQYFIQEYIKFLRTLGEWRVVIVEGEIVYCVFTHSNGEDVRSNLMYPQYTLSQMS